MNKNKIRFMADCMQVREENEGKESRTIEGKAIVFNAETTLWDGKYYREREIISPSCCTLDFLREQDIKLNLLHNRNDSIARNNKGVGTLNLELREDGLYFNCEVPKCDIGDRALELIRNKTYTGCSFEFFPEEWKEENKTLPDGREDILITHTKFAAITALTIAMDPAYGQTSVNEREEYEKRENDYSQKEEAVREAKNQELEQKENEKLTRERALANRQRDIEILELQNK